MLCGTHGSLPIPFQLNEWGWDPWSEMPPLPLLNQIPPEMEKAEDSSSENSQWDSDVEMDWDPWDYWSENPEDDSDAASEAEMDGEEVDVERGPIEEDSGNGSNDDEGEEGEVDEMSNSSGSDI